jgi:hypothetical protein
MQTFCTQFRGSVQPPPPQVMFVRVVPQLSVPDSWPQFFPSREQNVAFGSGVQPHTFATPPPPHVKIVPGQMPHDNTVRDTPQLSFSVTAPQFFPTRVQNAVSVSRAQTNGLMSRILPLTWALTNIVPGVAAFTSTLPHTPYSNELRFERTMHFFVVDSGGHADPQKDGMPPSEPPPAPASELMASASQKSRWKKNTPRAQGRITGDDNMVAVTPPVIPVLKTVAGASTL